MDMNDKKTRIIAVGVVVLAIFAGVAYAYFAPKSDTVTTAVNPTATASSAPTATSPAVQSKNDPKTRIDSRIDKMSKYLHLSEAQKSDVRLILDAAKNKSNAVAHNKSLSSEERKEQLLAIKTDTQSQIRSKLNPDQQKLLDQHAAKASKNQKTT